MHPSRKRSGFTLIELLTVISIIIILMGLLLPALNATKNAAKKTSAKSDLSQLTAAVRSFYTDYGYYPISASTTTTDLGFGGPTNGAAGSTNSLAGVINTLRADGNDGGINSQNVLNTRQTVYLDVPYTKNQTNPKSGLVKSTSTVTTPNGGTGSTGDWVDPWGNVYILMIDANYDGYTTISVLSPGLSYNDISYAQDPNQANAIQGGCIAGCYGADGQIGTKGNKNFAGSDDVLSWQ